MRKPLTPGRMVVLAVALLAVDVVAALVLWPFDGDWAAETQTVIAWVTWIGAALLLVGAAVAKVVQIGVRSAKD